MDEEEESLLDLEPSIGEEQAPVGGQVKMMLREESGAGSAGSQPQSLDWGEDDGQGEQGGGGAAMLAASSPIPPKKRAEEDDGEGAGGLSVHFYT